MKIYVAGIDPGVYGGLSLIDDQGKMVKIYKTPSVAVAKNKKLRRQLDMQAAWARLSSLKKIAEVADARFVVCLEKVEAFFLDGVISAFSLGKNLGAWEGLITALTVPFHTVPPQVWKKDIIGKTVKAPKLTNRDAAASKSKQRAKASAARKALAIEKANQIFPYALLDMEKKYLDGVAESLLIAEWGRRNELGLLESGRSQHRIVSIDSPAEPTIQEDNT